MNILHLKYAVEISKVGSLNKAAENLFMNQPNLSRAIRELEANLGITIFERSSKGMVATPEGKQFLEYAKKILDQIDEVEAMYRNRIVSKKQFFISVPQAGYISEAFAQFSKYIVENEPAELFYKESDAMGAIKNILEADYKLGIIRYAEKQDKYFREMLNEKGLHHELIAEFQYQLIMSRKHPLAQKDKIHCDDLKPYIEICHTDPYAPSVPLVTVRKDTLPTDEDCRICTCERASQFDLLAENDRTYMWISPTPPKITDRYGLILKPYADHNHIYRDVLIYRKDYHLTALDEQFITELCKAKRQYF